MKAALLASLAIMLASCAGFGQELPAHISTRSDAASGACQVARYRAPTVLVLAKESVPEELDGLNYFANDWGLRQGCFRATVVTAGSGLDPHRFKGMIIDVSHDASLSAADVALARSFVSAGERLAVFGWPLRLSDLTVDTDALAGIAGLLGDFALRPASGCGDWQYTDAPRSPFDLGKTSYRYENFGSTIFTVEARGPQRPWANVLFCAAHPGAVMIEVPAGIVAGFSLAYSISLADNNVRAVAMKRLFVDVVNELAGPLPVLA